MARARRRTLGRRAGLTLARGAAAADGPAARARDRDCSDFATQARRAAPGTTPPRRSGRPRRRRQRRRLRVARRAPARRRGAPPRLAPARAVTRVVDGDTIKVARRRRAARPSALVGIDTPESRRPQTPVECGAKQAAVGAAPACSTATSCCVRDPTQDAVDRYGRTLAYVDVDAPRRRRGDGPRRLGEAVRVRRRGVRSAAAYRAAASRGEARGPACRGVRRATSTGPRERAEHRRGRCVSERPRRSHRGEHAGRHAIARPGGGMLEVSSRTSCCDRPGRDRSAPDGIAIRPCDSAPREPRGGASARCEATSRVHAPRGARVADRPGAGDERARARDAGTRRPPPATCSSSSPRGAPPRPRTPSAPRASRARSSRPRTIRARGVARRARPRRQRPQRAQLAAEAEALGQRAAQRAAARSRRRLRSRRVAAGRRARAGTRRPRASASRAGARAGSASCRC